MTETRKLLLATVAVLALTEIGARVCVDRLLVPPVIPRETGRFDAQLGWALVPSFVGVSDRSGEEVEYRINSKGLRDAEADYEKPASMFRIVTVGASRTFGYGVRIEQHFTTLLERQCPGIDVINMGVNAYGVDQELLFLDGEGWRYHPDLVIAYVDMLGDRHLQAIRHDGRMKPRFTLEDGALVLTNSPVPASFFDSSLHRWLTGASAAYDLLIDRGLEPIFRHRRRRQFVAAEARAAAGAAPIDGDELAARIVTEMALGAQRHGARFVLVTELAELHQRALRDGLTSINLSRELADPGFRLPGKLAHLNATGNAVLAREIATFLTARAIFPPGVSCDTGGR